MPTSRIIENHFKVNPKTNRYEIHGDWYLIKLLGSGAYGEVHQAREIKTNNYYAIKLDSRNNQEIDREVQYLKTLNGKSLHLPQIVEYGRYSGVSYFVMSILGASLSDLKKRRTNNRFSLSTVLRTSRQMLVALKDVHEMGIIHRDIKPANFVIGHKDPKRIFLIDFGLASEFHTGEERENIGFRGTNTYASVRIHQYKDPGRVDDLVSWFYCTLRILGIKFPWDKIKIPPKTERCGSKTIDTLFDKLVANGLLEQHLEEDQKQHLQNNLNDSNNNHQSNFEINSHAILKSESKKSKKNSIVVDKESVYMNTSLMHQSSANAQSSKRSSVKTKSPILSGLSSLNMSSALGLTKQNSNNLQLQVPNNHHNTSSNRSISSIFSKLKNENKITKDFKVEVLKKERKRIQNQFLIEKKAHPLEELLKDANDKFNFSYEIFYELCMHLNELKFADKPNYEMIDSLFEKALFDLNVNMRDLYDWEMEYEMQ